MRGNELKLHIDDSEVDELVEKLERARKEADRLVEALKEAKELQDNAN